MGDNPMTDTDTPQPATLLGKLYAERARLAMEIEHGKVAPGESITVYEWLQGRHATQINPRYESWDGGEIGRMIRELGGYLPRVQETSPQQHS